MILNILIWVGFLLLGWDVHACLVARAVLKSVNKSKKDQELLKTITKSYKRAKIEIATFIYGLIILIYLSQSI
ncbi:MAG: hypothetical protein WC307_06965 [Candidatus Nanoarchaeia archaeon]|jgi:hypothetical protein